MSMLWSKQKSPRFGAEKQGVSNVGPGSYEIPTTLDDHSVIITGSDRFQEEIAPTPGPGSYVCTKPTVSSTPNPSKENRPPSRDKSKTGVTATKDSRETELLKKQLAQEGRLRAQAEARLNEFKSSKRAAAEANSMATSATQKAEEAQKRFDQLSVKHQEVLNMVQELEADKAERQKTLQGKVDALAVAQKDLEESKAEIKHLKETSQEQLKKEAEVQALKADAELQKAKIQELEAALERLEAEAEAHAAELRKAQEELTERSVQVQELTSKLQEARDKTEAAAEAIYAKDVELKIMQERCRSLEVTEEHLNLKESELERVKAELSERHSFADQLCERLTAKEHELERMDADMKERCSCLEDMRQKLSTKESELEATTAQLKEESSSLRSHEQKLSTQVAELAAAQEEVERTSSLVARQKEELQAKEAELKHVVQTHEHKFGALEAELATAKKNIQAKEDEMQHVVETQEQKLSAQDDELAAAQDEVQRTSEVVSRQKEELKAKEKELQHVVKTHEQKLSAQEAELATAREEVQRTSALVERQKEELQAKEEELKHVAQTHEHKLSAQDDELAAAQEEIQRTASSVERQKEELWAKEKELQHAVTNLQATTKEAANMAAELASSKREIQRTSALIVDQEAEIQAMKEQLKESARNLEAAQTKNAELAAVKEELRCKTATVQEQAAQLVASADLQGQISTLQCALDLSKSATAELTAKLRVVEEQAALADQQGPAAEEANNRISELEGALTTTQAELAEVRSQKEQLQVGMDKLKFAEKSAQMHKSAKERAETQVRELKLDVEHWRQKAQSFDRDDDRMKRLEEDLSRTTRELDEQHQQNKELLMSVQQFKMEWEFTNAENQTLQESVASYEQNLDKAAEQNAKLAGHVNQRQKIHHMVNLKEENKELREQLKKAKHRITQLGVSRKGEGLLEALASFSYAPGLGADQVSVAPSVCNRSVAESEVRTPKRPGTPTRKTPRGSHADTEELTKLLDEERRRQLLQEMTVERVQTDFQHFIALIERALLMGDCLDDSNMAPAVILERLRAVIANSSTRGHVVPRETSPRNLADALDAEPVPQ